MASCSRYGLILVTILTISLTSKSALANQYDDDEKVRRAIERLDQIDQNAREEAKRKYNYEHGVIPNSMSEDWKQIEYNSEQKKREEANVKGASSTNTPPTDNSPNYFLIIMVLAIPTMICAELIKRTRNKK